MKRTFVGIEILPGNSFIQHFERMKEVLANEKIRWASPEHFHLTLHFFGDTTEKDMHVISAILDDTAAVFPPVTLGVSGLGIFRSLKHPRVLWAGLKHTGELKQFRDNFEKRLMLRGFDTEDRPFRPHLTLGRMKRVQDTGKLASLLEEYRDEDFFTFTASEVVYFESILSQKGSIYKKISGHMLEG